MKKAVIFLTMLCTLFYFTGCISHEKKTSQVFLSRVSAKPVQRQTSFKDEKTKQTTDGGYKPLNYDVMKGIWISYIDLEPMLTGKTADEFSQEFETACKNICDMGFNTIYVQVRPFGDALYNSAIYPASRLITGTAGKYADFDPLEIMTEISHRYALSFHGWINPLRCETSENSALIPEKFQLKKWFDDMENSDILRRVEGDTHLWLNPAYKEVRSMIAQGAAEIVNNYNVDGIHFDDYFYPTVDKDFDSFSYSENSQGQSLDNWRRTNISEMVKEIYNEVKQADKNVLVGISPQGNNDNNYNKMYADVSQWVKNGIADYIEPQIYFGYENSVKPFIQTMEEWEEICGENNVKLIIGIGAYKISSDEEKEFSQEGIISRQIKDSLEKGHGVGIYSYGSLFFADENNAERINEEIPLIKSVLS